MVLYRLISMVRFDRAATKGNEMQKKNLLVIISDMYARNVVGCYGNPIVKTPNLDALAARGTRFTNAYCNSPLCVPSRASLATGRYAHEVKGWGNGHPYNGNPPGWGHRLMGSNHKVTSIGKLHYRETGDNNGFDEEILPMHVPDGVGDLLGLIRNDPPTYESTRSLAEDAGPGESSYTEYDRKITSATCKWLENDAPNHTANPWVLFTSFVSPHFPLTAPEEFYNLYPHDNLPYPLHYKSEERSTHPCIDVIRKVWNYDDYFNEENIPKAIAAYYGLCSFLDSNVGEVLSSLEQCNLTEDTRVLFIADHGDNLGNHGLWGTSTMYEGSTGIPMILAGADIPENKSISTIVSLVDVYPTVLESVGETLTSKENALPGDSLFGIANGETPDRTVLTEYHGGGSNTGVFMIRVDNWKYVHYVGYPCQLFDLDSDPNEANDLGEDPQYEEVRARCEGKLRELVDPDTVNAQAFSDQEIMIERHGGVEAILKRGDYGFSPTPD